MIKDHLQYNEKVKPNTAFENELRNKLPEFFNKNGFDLEKFKAALKDKNVAEFSEGYQLDFIGKDYARKQAGDASTSVIVPDNYNNQQPENKNSKNLFFTGDNLEVLRHLRNAYSNKIDVIYIDPPYNTGNDDFVYPDKFAYSKEQLEEIFGMSDEDINKLDNLKGSKSHSAWLTFMYPRLWLAKQLLSDDGVIFVSIDDNEQANLKLLMDSIFGENNFIAQFSWERTATPSNLSNSVKKSIEYILSFKKNKINKFKGIKKSSPSNNGLMNQTNNTHILLFPKNKINTSLKNGIYKKGEYGTKKYNIKLLNDVEVKNKIFINDFQLKGKFKWSQQKLDEELLKGTKISIKTKVFSPSYEREEYKVESPKNLIDKNDNVGTNEEASDYLDKLLGKGIFSNSKPVSLIKYVINFTRKKEGYFLDFFAGSSTTADAVMQLNAEDGGHRQFIMVQLPEKTYEIDKNGNKKPTKGGKAAFDAGYMSIDEISRERIRRAAKKIKEEHSDLHDFDGGFKHYRVVAPTKQTLDEINDFDSNNISLFTNMVDLFSSEQLNIAGNASGEETILTTWLAEDGYSFDANIKKVDFDGYKALLVENNRLYIINEGWSSNNTKALLNKLGTYQLTLQTIVLFGYSLSISSLRELEIGLKQLDENIDLLKRY